MLREGKWQTRFFRKGWGCLFFFFFYLCCYVCVSACVCQGRKILVAFLMSGVSWKGAEGQMIICRFQMRRERMRWSDLGVVFFDCRVSLLLFGWWLIDSNWKKPAGCGGGCGQQVQAKEVAESWRCHRWACADRGCGFFFVPRFFGGPVPRHHLTTSEGFYTESTEVWASWLRSYPPLT